MSMRDFTDADGNLWHAYAVEEEGTDYKGRLYLVLERADSGSADPLALRDVRWNSERTARRTLRTMSVVELRKRLRSAEGRATSPVEV